MAEEKDPKGKETSPQTRTPSAEYPEALVEKVLQEHPEVLRKVVAEYFQRRMDLTADKGRGLDVVPVLNDGQKELEEQFKLSRDGIAGPSKEQFKDSTKVPTKIVGVHGDDPPEWALKRRQ